jgi:DNA-binding transcriptional MerR regulator
MTDEQRLTLKELAGAVGMTTRNVRAYQTRGLLQPPRRSGRTSVYTGDHVERLQQVQRARARGASLQLLQTLIAEGRDLDGVWESRDRPAQRPVVDISDAALGHTPQCLAHLDVPLDGVLRQLGRPDTDAVRLAVRALVDIGVFGRRGDGFHAPGTYGCAAGVLHEQGVIDSATTGLRLTQLVADAAEAMVAAVAGALRSLDADARRAAAGRLGELAGAVVTEVVTVRVAAPEDRSPS